MSRLTYYKVENDQIVKKRFQQPPEGWTRNKISLQSKLRANKTQTVTIQKLIEKEEEDNELKSLREKVEALQAKTRRQEKEIEALNKRLNTDSNAIKTKEEDHRNKRSLEIERLATFAKNNCGVPEEKYYELKRLAQGLKQQLEVQKERAEEARESMIQYRRARSLMVEQRDKREELATIFYSVILKSAEIIEAILQSSYLPEEKTVTLNRKLALLLAKVESSIRKIGWEKPEPVSFRLY